MDKFQATPSTPPAFAAPSHEPAAKVGDVVRFVANEKTEPCNAIVVAIGQDGVAELKVLPNPHPNPARDREPIQFAPAVPFTESPADFFAAAKEATPDRTPSGCWTI